ncbi:MAG: hypothetical protein Kow0089_21880 [Desulfobulbaceae bacterium]
MITNIRFESPTPSADHIIFELNGPYLPTGKALPGDNPRVYFDFPDTVPANKVKNRMEVNGNFVKRIRHAYHKTPQEKTRVVFDLVANQKMDFSQSFDKDTNTLVVSLYLAGTTPEPLPVEKAPPPGEKAAGPPPGENEPQAAVQPVPEQTLSHPSAKEPPPAGTSKPAEEPPPAQAPEPELPSLVRPAAQPVPEQPAEAPEKTDVVTKAAAEQAGVVETGKISATDEKTLPMEPPPPEKTSTPTQVAALPPAEREKELEKPQPPAEEATMIQPMSEVGVQETTTSTGAPVLYSIEFDPESNRGEMISFKLNGFHPPVVFGIEEDIPRIVCFFKNATAGEGLRDIIGTNGRYVKNIKVGKYRNPDNIRVVLELVPGNNYDLQQIFFKDDKVFMVIINKAGKPVPTQGG